MQRWLERLTDRLLPPALALAPDNDTRRRARLVVSFSLAIFVCGLAYGAIYIALGMHVSALGASVAAIVLFATPFVQYRTRSVNVGAHLASFGTYAALGLVTAPTGGLAAPAVAWLALVPVTALMLGGRKIGLAWTALSLGTVVVYFALHATGHTPPSEVPAAWLTTLRLGVNVGLVAVIAFLTLTYESNKDRMLGEVRAVNDALSRAKDEAETAHRGARLVLDHVGQGLVVASRNGAIEGECSTALSEMLPISAEGATKPVHLWDLFESSNATFAMQLQLGFDALVEDFLPFEVCLDQLPRTFRAADRTLQLEYVPIDDGDASGTINKLLVVITDVTANLRAVELERSQREQLDVFKWIVRDRAFFIDFSREAERLIASLASNTGDSVDQLRVVHTLKGTASLFGLSSFAARCHEIEDQVRDAGDAQMTDAQRTAITASWVATREMFDPMLGVVAADDENGGGGGIVIARADYDALLTSLADLSPSLHASVQAWSSSEPISAHLHRLAEHAHALSSRLCHRPVAVEVTTDGTRLPPDAWSSFWAASVHVIRNAIDHGIESTEERIASGKNPTGKLLLQAHRHDDAVVVEVTDDGRGINWADVRERAVKLGLVVANDADLSRALFADGLSTRDEVTETSGRGVGMGAVMATCESLGGSVVVASELGRGTSLRFTIPLAA